MTKTAIALILLAALSACQTIEGAGEDIQSAGQVIETEANDVQNDM